jgi:hypothetical protein
MLVTDGHVVVKLAAVSAGAERVTGAVQRRICDPVSLLVDHLIDHV